MKKLMIATAALCAAVGASALESSNVVGYDQVGLRRGAKPAGAAFVPTTGGNVDLQSLTVTGYNHEEGYGDGDVAVQTLDPYGLTLKTFTWVDVAADPDDPESVDLYGWYDNDTDELGELTIAPGEGLYAYGPNTDFSIQSAGQVPTSDIAVVLRRGAKCIVNPTPVTISLNGGKKDGWTGIFTTGYNVEEGYGDGDVAVQTLDPYGRTLKTFTWVDVAADPDDPESVDLYGWYDNDTDELGELELVSGDGLYAYGPNTTFSIVFPGVTL